MYGECPSAPGQRRAGIAWILPLSCTQLLLSLQFLAAGRRRLGGSAFDSIITISHGRRALSW
jgi:hypothetical protein